MLGIGKAARLHTSTAENQATYMKRTGKTDDWAATAAWTGGLAVLLTLLTGGIWDGALGRSWRVVCPSFPKPVSGS